MLLKIKKHVIICREKTGTRHDSITVSSSLIIMAVAPQIL